MSEGASHNGVRRSTGNVFRDLKLPRADEAHAKAELARQISDIVRAGRMTQAACAELLGIDQPKVSALMRGKLSGFSTDRLLRFITALGQDVEIHIRNRGSKRHRGRIRVRRQSST